MTPKQKAVTIHTGMASDEQRKTLNDALADNYVVKSTERLAETKEHYETIIYILEKCLE